MVLNIWNTLVLQTRRTDPAKTTEKLNSTNVPERQRLNNSLAEMVSRWTEWTNKFDTPITSRHFGRWKNPTNPTSYTLESSVCLIAQEKNA